MQSTYIHIQLKYHTPVKWRGPHFRLPTTSNNCMYVRNLWATIVQVLHAGRVTQHKVYIFKQLAGVQ